MLEQQAFILFGEALESNVEDLNDLLADGWQVIHTCPMPSAVSANMPQNASRFFEPQCVIILQKIT